MNKRVSFMLTCVGIVLICFGSFNLLFSDNGDNDITKSDNINENKNENGKTDGSSTEDVVTSSKKFAYVDTLLGYVSSSMTKVNFADDFKFFDTDVLYLIPVGSSDKCIYQRIGGTSPFSDTWKYAYVGVTYNESGYDYFVVALDSFGYGIDFVNSKKLESNGGVLIKNKNNLIDIGLYELYDTKDLRKYSFVQDDEFFAFSEVEGLEKIAKTAERSKVFVVSNCEYP